MNIFLIMCLKYFILDSLPLLLSINKREITTVNNTMLSIVSLAIDAGRRIAMK